MCLVAKLPTHPMLEVVDEEGSLMGYLVYCDNHKLYEFEIRFSAPIQFATIRQDDLEIIMFKLIELNEALKKEVKA